ncbi:MAG: hypothetical protein ACI9DM_002943, partial [Cyclobacteriaceae bacterium]
MIEFEQNIRLLERRIARNTNPEHLVTLYGSSTIRLWSTMQVDLAPINCMNLGFGGSHFDACIYYFDRVFASIKPAQIVIYGGDNDLSQGYDAYEIFERFKLLCEMINVKFPTSKLSAISIKPSIQRLAKLDTILLANRLMGEHLNNIPNAYQINVFDALLNDEGLPR